jgi:RNA polymerase sigma-70 factor (ECF subfamily)
MATHVQPSTLNSQPSILNPQLSTLVVVPVTSTSLESSFLLDPDVQLMLRLKAGEEEAFAELVSRYQGRLINIFAQLTGDRTAAEDLAQDAFLRIYRARHGYQPTARFSTWVFRIAQNLASNNRRQKGRRKEVPLKPTESGALSTRPHQHTPKEKSALMPARQLDRGELREHVRVAVASLNDRQKMALLLHKFEEMSYDDIAETMELTPAAVKSLLSRARENLRVKLDAYMT